MLVALAWVGGSLVGSTAGCIVTSVGLWVLSFPNKYGECSWSFFRTWVHGCGACCALLNLPWPAAISVHFSTTGGEESLLKRSDCDGGAAQLLRPYWRSVRPRAVRREVAKNEGCCRCRCVTQAAAPN